MGPNQEFDKKTDECVWCAVHKTTLCSLVSRSSTIFFNLFLSCLFGVARGYEQKPPASNYTEARNQIATEIKNTTATEYIRAPMYTRQNGFVSILKNEFGWLHNFFFCKLAY